MPSRPLKPPEAYPMYYCTVNKGMENRWREGRNKRGGEAAPQWVGYGIAKCLRVSLLRQSWLFPQSVKMASINMLPKPGRVGAKDERESRVC